MKRGHRAVLAMALAAATISPAALLAQTLPPPKVILLRPPTAPGAVGEALVRLQAELTVEGFDAQVIEIELGPDVRASLEKIAPTVAATAVVAVVAGGDPASAELWVVDRMTGKTVVRRVHADPKAAARIAEVLSVRAVELLRASFLELAITSRPSPDVVDVELPSAPVVTRFATEALEEPDWRWAVEAGGGGVGAIQGASETGTTLMSEFLPVARVQRAFSARLCARVSVAGLGTQAHVDMPGGYANVSQNFAIVEGLVRFRRGRRLEPVASLGAGILYLAAEGHETSPYIAGNAYRVSAAADAGIGLRMPLRARRVELGVEFHALLAEPYPSVRFFGQEVARAGRPSLLASVTLLGGI